jgi:hypothetical protein
MKNYLSTTEAAHYYGVCCDLLRQWRRWQGFPVKAVELRGRTAFWDVTRVDAWLRSRPVAKVGRPARWLAVVGHPSLTPSGAGEPHATAS